MKSERIKVKTMWLQHYEGQHDDQIRTEKIVCDNDKEVLDYLIDNDGFLCDFLQCDVVACFLKEKFDEYNNDGKEFCVENYTKDFHEQATKENKCLSDYFLIDRKISSNKKCELCNRNCAEIYETFNEDFCIYDAASFLEDHYDENEDFVTNYSIKIKSTLV